MLSMFSCCVSEENKYETQVDVVEAKEISQEMTELLTSKAGRDALNNHFFNKDQAVILGCDLLEEVLLTPAGLSAFKNNVIDIHKILVLLNDLSKKNIPAVNVFEYLISDPGQTRLISGNLAWNKISEEFAASAIKLGY